MNRIVIKLIIIFCLAPPIFAQGVVHQSPNKKLQVSINIANKLGSDWGKDEFGEYLSISLGDGNLPLLWVGIAYKDESGFPPEIIWGKSSKTALLVYRPQRGEIVLGVIRPDAVSKFEPVFSDEQWNKFAAGMNVDPRDAVKRWSEKWIETADGVYEGDLIIAATTVRKLHLQIATGKIPAIVSIMNQKDGN